MSKQVHNFIKTTMTSLFLWMACQSTLKNTAIVKEEEKRKHLCPHIYQEMKVYAKQELDPDDSLLPSILEVNAYLFVCHVYGSLVD